MSSQEKQADRTAATSPKRNSAGETPAKSPLVRPARAELIWDGKYDANGRRVAPLRVALP
jgi:hypothetical protein